MNCIYQNLDKVIRLFDFGFQTFLFMFIIYDRLHHRVVEMLDRWELKHLDALLQTILAVVSTMLD